MKIDHHINLKEISNSDKIDPEEEYIEHLRNLKPIHIPKKDVFHWDHEKMEHTVITHNEVKIGPLNTSISHKNIKHVDNNHIMILKATQSTTQLPSNFNWRDITTADIQSTVDKKKIITKPPNQYMCGSCWAVSTASAISDNFIVKGFTAQNPQISATDAMTSYPQSYPQNGCSGGSPHVLLQAIANGNGIRSKHCIDYSWCATNQTCTMGQTTVGSNVNNLSNLIPSKGCYYNTDLYVYNVNTNSGLFNNLHPQITNTAEVIKLTKSQIYINGPVVAAYVVLDNFMNGNFTKINGGVYFENIDYVQSIKTNNIVFSSYKNFKYMGGHAVVVIGWGIEKNILYDTNKKKDIPYWLVRNSWGTNWGSDGGYFKIAMYPYNKFIQFSNSVKIQLNSGIVRGGGFYFINVKPLTFNKTPPPTFNKTPQQPQTNPQLINSTKLKQEQYYKTSPNITQGVNRKTEIKLTNPNAPTNLIIPPSQNKTPNSNNITTDLFYAFFSPIVKYMSIVIVIMAIGGLILLVELVKALVKLFARKKES